MSNPPTLITLAQLRAVFPKIDPIYVPLLNEAMANFGITTKYRIAAFLSQSGHESVRFMKFEENLNYSAEGLTKTFRKYFPTLASAQPYHRQPQKIANRVYANRMGNGDTASGDGWNFRGRGAIQLTGKNNYQRFAASFKISLADAIKFLSTPKGQIMSAIWFWNENKLNALADAQNMREITQRINGGQNGAVDRMELYHALIRVL